MNKGSNNHYSLLLQDETETDGIGLEEEEEEEGEGDADMNVMEEEEDFDDDDEDHVEDSDEEEIFSSSKHRTLSHDGANLNGQNHLGGHGNEYRLLNNNDADLKAVIDTPITIWAPTPMSPARRACFIASIMFGVLMVATFLWVLPCDVQPCEGEMGLSDTDWAVKIEGMGINQTKLVRRLSGGQNVLLSYYTSNNISGWHTDNTTVSDEVWKLDQLTTGCNNCGDGDDGEGGSNDIIGDGQCGLLMLDGNLGREIWRLPLTECPIDLQCDLLDASGDHVPDCIVRGSHSMIFMIEARYGTIMWYLHQHKDSEEKSAIDVGTVHSVRPPAKLLYPGAAILLPDVNNDTFGDLLFSGLLTHQSPLSWNSDYTDSELWSSESELPSSRKSPPLVNNLVVVCGQSGSVLGNPLVLEQCQRILALSLEGQLVTYTCQGVNGRKEPGKIHLTALLHQVLGSSAPTEESPIHENPLNSPQVHTKKRDACRVIVYNKDICPGCQSKVLLYKADGNVLWQREYEHSGVVSWASLLINNECHGVVLKVWEYKQTTTVVKAAKPPPINNRTTRSSLITEDENADIDPAGEEKDDPDLQLAILTNSTVSASNHISTLLHKGSIASLNNQYSLANKEKYTSTQSPESVNIESSRLRREFDRDAGESPDVYEHPTIHRHRGKMTSGNHNDPDETPKDYSDVMEEKPDRLPTLKNYLIHPKQTLNTAKIPSTFPSGIRSMPPDVLAPPGYQLQHIHEQISVIRFNGSVWYEDNLTSIGITQLCRDTKSCIPDMKSHCKSVAVNPGVKEGAWQLVTSTTTFVSTPLSGEERHTAPWTLTSILRKIILTV